MPNGLGTLLHLMIASLVSTESCKGMQRVQLSLPELLQDVHNMCCVLLGI
jgi:hypothetical protein